MKRTVLIRIAVSLAAAGLVLGTALDAADRQRRAELKAQRERRST